MHADAEYLRHLYGSLSDEALYEVDRADLVEAAQQCYDAEVARREQASAAPDERLTSDEEGDLTAVLNAETRGPYIENAFEILRAAGIPCSLESREVPAESPRAGPHTICELLVPDQLNLRASNILEREMSNQDYENFWSAHLEGLSDNELLALNPEEVLCGLFDRVERVNRAYADEIAHRRLKKP